MTYTPKAIKVSDVVNGYVDLNDDGVFGYGGKLTIRPNFQREFVYNEKQRNEVIVSVFKRRPLNAMYWSKNVDDSGNDTYELIDGQQRTISICQYVKDTFAAILDGNARYFHNLTNEEQKRILDYELLVEICEGTEAQKLEWFRTINIANAVLTDQELRNATYCGPWVSDAKLYFSKRGCVAYKSADGYIKGNSIRQEYLEKVISWAVDKDNLSSIEEYMALHQHDTDASELWRYFTSVIKWAKELFPKKIKGVTDSQDWGLLYNKYKDNFYDSTKLSKELDELLQDDDVTKHSGTIPYLLSDRSINYEKYLSIRAFTENQKRRAYERQNHKCPICGKEFAFEDMQGDHIIPWSQGGHTTDDNLQMLCKDCNRHKANK